MTNTCLTCDHHCVPEMQLLTKGEEVYCLPSGEYVNPYDDSRDCWEGEK